MELVLIMLRAFYDIKNILCVLPLYFGDMTLLSMTLYNKRTAWKTSYRWGGNTETKDLALASEPHPKPKVKKKCFLDWRESAEVNVLALYVAYSSLLFWPLQGVIP